MSWLLAAPALACLALVALNALTWTRGAPAKTRRGVSLLVPARNEEQNLAACVRAALAARPPPLEVLIYDDESTDRTAEVITRLGREDARVRAVEAEPLPAGWVGKPHACQRLGEAAAGEVLLFLDADVRLEPVGPGLLLGLFEDGADVVTAVPRQETRSFFERLVVPLLHVVYAALLPLALIPRTRDPRVLAASGQILALKREAWRRLEGFCRVRDAIVDDMALCRAAKEAGLRVVFADGHAIARCRMYRSAREVWEGFSKNLYLGLGARPSRLAVAVVLLFSAFLLPYAALLLSPLLPALFAPALVGVTANVLLRAILAARHRQPLEGIALHPIAVLALFAIAANSVLWTRKGRVRWRGRTYRTREGARA